MAYSGLWQDTLPWSDSERDRKLTGYVVISLAITVVFFAIVQFLPLMDTEEKKLDEVAPRLAKLIIEQKAKPKPPPPKPKAKKKDKEKPKPKPKEKKKADKPKPKPKPKAKPKPDRSELARKKAQRHITEVEDALADLRDFDVASLDKNKAVKSGATRSKSNDTTTAIIAGKAKQGSGGINTSRLSRATGGGNLKGRSTTNVRSSLGASGGAKGKRSGGSGRASRPYEEIELVFQKNKGRIFSLYSRALRKDPSLQGKIVLELTISPSGKVIKVRVVSSAMNNAELERKLLARVKGFRFKNRSNVDTLVVKYPIDFLPT